MANLESIPYKTLQAVARKAGIRPLNQARASLEIAIANAARTIAIGARLAARTPSCGKHTSNFKIKSWFRLFWKGTLSSEIH